MTVPPDLRLLHPRQYTVLFWSARLRVALRMSDFLWQMNGVSPVFATGMLFADKPW